MACIKLNDNDFANNWSAIYLADPITKSFSGQAHTHTHTRLTALCPELPGWASTRKVKPSWILLKQEVLSGSGISRAVCKSAPRSRQITTPATHQAGCPSYRPTNSVKALKTEYYSVLCGVLLCGLPLAAGVEVRYVLPVLWMTSYLRTSEGSSALATQLIEALSHNKLYLRTLERWRKPG